MNALSAPIFLPIGPLFLDHLPGVVALVRPALTSSYLLLMSSLFGLNPQLVFAPFPANPKCLYHAYVLCAGGVLYGDARTRSSSAARSPPAPSHVDTDAPTAGPEILARVFFLPEAEAEAEAEALDDAPSSFPGKAAFSSPSTTYPLVAPEAANAAATARENAGSVDRRSTRTSRGFAFAFAFAFAAAPFGTVAPVSSRAGSAARSRSSSRSSPPPGYSGYSPRLRSPLDASRRLRARRSSLASTGCIFFRLVGDASDPGEPDEPP